jgi:anti-sigma regulatory factor (Ser/Thr protein kinase)
MESLHPASAIELQRNSSAPGAARAFVRNSWAQQASPETLDLVGLCVSELVTNAIDHAQPPYRLRLSERGPTLRVELEDSTAEPPVVRSQHPLQARGRGMFLVQSLSLAWGVLPSETGKTVWAEF